MSRTLRNCASEWAGRVSLLPGHLPPSCGGLDFFDKLGTSERLIERCLPAHVRVGQRAGGNRNPIRNDVLE